MGQLRQFGTDTINLSGEAMKVADNSIGTSDIIDGTIVTADLADNAVTQDKIALPKMMSYRQSVSVADFTDGGAAAGTLDLSITIPEGAVYAYTLINNVTGFAGDTSAVITVGDGTDVDRYNTGTPNVFATANALSAGAPSGTVYHSGAKTPKLTITSATDFTLVKTNAAGRLDVSLFWYQGY